MTRSVVKSWFAYAAVGLVATLLAAGIAMLLVPAGAVKAVWVAAAIAYVLQVLAFALLLALRFQPNLFLTAWLAGMVLRFGTVGVCAAWLSRSDVLPRGPMLLSLVGFVFLLVLLEPVFLRWDMRGRRNLNG